MSIARIIEPATAALDRTLASHRRASLWLSLLSLALFLPGFFSLQPMDRDEPRFAQATKQMLETGDYVSIRFQDEARNKKPVGIYWMQAAVVSAADALGLPQARTTIWVYRLVSLLGAVSAVLLTYWTALAFLQRRNAFLAALLLASTILLGVEARLAKTDAVVLATVMAAMGALARFYLAPKAQRGWGLPFIFWTAIGLGLLVKGPITPMVPLFAGVVLAVKDRGARWLPAMRPLPGLVWALLLVVPWFVLIMVATKGAFLTDSVGNDMLGKVSSGQEAHGAPPLTYFVAFWVTAWPMAPLAALAAPFAWRARREPAVAFLLAWIVPFWLLFEAIPTKLPHYVLPVYPAIAILIAIAIERGELALSRTWGRVMLRLLPGLALLLFAVGMGLSFYTGRAPGTAAFAVTPFLLWLAFHLLRDIGREPIDQSVLGGVALAFCAYVFVFSGVMTSGPFEPWRMSPRLSEASQRVAKLLPECRRLDPATSGGFNEPSLVFLTGTSLRMIDGAQTARFIEEQPCRVAFVDVREEAAFRSALAPTSQVALYERVQGVNLNGGRKLDIAIYARKPAP
ncbi:MAG: putative glycosyl transferase, family 39 [Hyphomicrobiales bacterium]|nr:putative glycosyl transferase, family 39 [Hyphomicrobiales bacterium]